MANRCNDLLSRLAAVSVVDYGGRCRRRSVFSPSTVHAGGQWHRGDDMLIIPSHRCLSGVHGWRRCVLRLEKGGHGGMDVQDLRRALGDDKGVAMVA